MVQRDPITAATIDLVHSYNDAFNKGDVDGVMAAMTDDCIVETPMPPPDGTRFQGQKAVRALWNEFFQSSSSIEFDTEDLFAGSVRGVDLFRIRDGKVSEKLVYVKG
jgi:ketosteroid isomerase-like protein